MTTYFIVDCFTWDFVVPGLENSSIPIYYFLSKLSLTVKVVTVGPKAIITSWTGSGENIFLFLHIQRFIKTEKIKMTFEILNNYSLGINIK